MYAPFDGLLDTLLSSGEEQYGDAWSDELESAFSGLEGSYKELRNSKRALIEYGSLPFQTAYVFKYSPCRASFLAGVLRHFENESDETLFIRNNELSFALIGGGPGSEIPGILDFFATSKHYKGLERINLTIFDKESEWANVLEALTETYEHGLLGEVRFEECDFSLASTGLPSLDEFDGVVLGYFVSEICSLPNNALVRDNVATCLSTLPKHATVIYIDSNAYSFYDCMNSIRSRVAGLTEVAEYQAELSIAFPDTDVFSEFVEDNDHRPHLNGRVLAKHMTF